jgi:uncharacterized protein DUF6502
MEEALEVLADALQPIAVAMIKGNLSASALVQAAKLAYIRGAVASLNSEGRKKTNISRLSVVTGMTRKEVASYLQHKASPATATSPKKQMEHRALRVLRAWATDPRYKMVTGRVLDLPMEGGGKTFAALVRSCAGDVTTVAVLRELERLRAVTRSSSGLLRVRPGCMRAQLRVSARFRDFGRLLADFSETAGQVLVERAHPLYFGFKDLEICTESQAARFKSSFGRRASLLLEGVEHWRTRGVQNAKRSRHGSKRKAQRIGVGVYLVEGQARSEFPLLRKR